MVDTGGGAGTPPRDCTHARDRHHLLSIHLSRTSTHRCSATPSVASPLAITIRFVATRDSRSLPDCCFECLTPFTDLIHSFTVLAPPPPPDRDFHPTIVVPYIHHSFAGHIAPISKSLSRKAGSVGHLRSEPALPMPTKFETSDPVHLCTYAIDPTGLPASIPCRGYHRDDPSNLDESNTWPRSTIRPTT